MDAQDFVDAIRDTKVEWAVRGTLSGMRKPLGRKVTPESRALSTWYNALGDVDKAFVEQAVRNAAHLCAFGLLVVLDGASIIHEDQKEGRFRLLFESDTVSDLSDQDGMFLHDRY